MRGDGVRHSYTPNLGIFTAVTGGNGDILIPEARLRTALAMSQTDGGLRWNWTACSAAPGRELDVLLRRRRRARTLAARHRLTWPSPQRRGPGGNVPGSAVLP